MPRPIGWRQLIPGILLVGVFAVLLFGIFRYARVGALRGDTIRLHALAEDAAGLAQGSEVWLGGQKIGLVRRVTFAPVTSDTTGRVVIVTDVLADYRDQLRRDSHAEIRAGGSLIGAKVLMLSLGTPGSPPLVDGDTIITRGADLEVVTSQAAVASREFPAIIANVKVLAAQLGSARGTVGAILTSDAGGEQLSALTQRTSQLAATITRGSGTVGRVFSGEATARARHAAAQVDTLRALLASGSAALGGFRRDSTLLGSVQDLRNEVSIVRALLDEPRGTAGRVLRDQAINQELTAADAELAALIADMKARPLRYVAF